VAWQSTADRERSVRRRVLKASRILFKNRMSSMDCTVRTLAEDAAGLDVTSSIGIRETFNLAIESDAFYSCEPGGWTSTNSFPFPFGDYVLFAWE